MQRDHKPREIISSEDESAATKAAAWAWYQRGSGSESRPTSEFSLKRTQRVPNPTRYKLEAERSKAKSSTTIYPPSEDHDQDDSHLLDKYEIESISKQLENYIERGNSGDWCDDHRRVVSSPESDVSVMINKEEKKSKRMTKGFWLTRHGVLACGASRNDVVEFGRGLRQRQRRPEKGGGGVATNWRPRTTS